MSKKVVTVDVREDIQRGQEPFSKIMAAASRLKQDEELLLIAPFEPVPLYGVLGQRGFTHQTTPTSEGAWEILFSRGTEAAVGSRPAAPPTAASKSSSNAACSGTPVVSVDTRGLEPPEPLVRILEALTTLPEGARLRAHTDRRPMHLYAQLEERGFSGVTEEQADGSFITHVHRR
jgi:uncharacterized protein (DUF2249 family)